jgi:hypothetical protein
MAWHLQPHLLRHVFVAAAGEVHDHHGILAELGRALDGFGDGVGAFEGGDDAFESREAHEGVERLVVGGVGVFHAALVVQPGVFGADGGVVEPGADAVGELNLAVSSCRM